MTTVKNDIISWVKTYTKDLLGYAIIKVHHYEVAEDLVQDTFLSAHQAYENFKSKSNVKTWFFSILKHKIADHYRLKYKENTETSSVILQEFFNETKDGNLYISHRCNSYQALRRNDEIIERLSD